jgi:hypothetical protein
MFWGWTPPPSLTHMLSLRLYHWATLPIPRAWTGNYRQPPGITEGWHRLRMTSQIEQRVPGSCSSGPHSGIKLLFAYNLCISTWHVSSLLDNFHGKIALLLPQDGHFVIYPILYLFLCVSIELTQRILSARNESQNKRQTHIKEFYKWSLYNLRKEAPGLWLHFCLPPVG